MRDVKSEDTIYIGFTTRAFATGIPTTLAGSPVVSAYEDAGTTEITAGITLSVDHDGVTGLNMLTIVATSANGYDTGKDYNLVITTGTVGGVSVVGEVIGRFTLDRSPAAQDLANGTDGLTAIKAVIDAIPTTAMRGTDSAALASVCTEARLAELAAANLPADVDTLLTRVTDARMGALTDWINGGRLDLILDIIAADVVNIDGDAMRGTDGANTTVPDAAGTATGLHATTDGLISGLNDPTEGAIADAVWDELLTGASHNIPTSAGRRLRTAGVDASLIRENTCQAGSTSSTIKLDAGASATNTFYDHMWCYITAGTGVGQVRTLHDYVGATKIAGVGEDWLTTPDDTSEFAIVSLGSVHVHELSDTALAQLNDISVDDVWDEVLTSGHEVANSASRFMRGQNNYVIETGTVNAFAGDDTVELDPGTVLTGNGVVGMEILITAGTGIGQRRKIISFDSGSKIATVDRVWVDYPDTDSDYLILDGNPSDLQTEGMIHAGSTSTTAVLAGSASGDDDEYIGSLIVITNGSGAESQARVIIDYDQASDTVTVDRAWNQTPALYDTYIIIPGSGEPILRILGLVGQNVVYDDFTFDGDKNHTVGKAYIYDTKAHADAHVEGGGAEAGCLGVIDIAGNYTSALPTSIYKTKDS